MMIENNEDVHLDMHIDPDFDEDEEIDDLSKNFNVMWNSLEPKLDDIYEEDPCVDLTFLINCYAEVFTYAMNVNKKNMQLRNEGQQEFAPGESHKALSYLYLQAISYIESKASSFAVKYDETLTSGELLSSYSNDWRKFKAVHRKLQFVFKYLDVHYVPIEREDINAIGSSILEIYKFALKTWYNKIFVVVQELVAEEIITKIKADRNGIEIDRAMVSCASKSFIEIGEMFNEEDPLQLYKQLETKFVDSTCSDYKDKSRKFMNEINLLKSMAFTDYIHTTNEILSNEKTRVETFMDVSSLDLIISICEKCLIKDHDELFNTYFNQCLVKNEREMISQVYELISRFPDDLAIFKVTFRDHIVKEANDEIGNMSNLLNPDPKEYVEILIKIMNKYESIIEAELKGNEEFKSASLDAAEDFINDNIAAKVGNGQRNSKLLVMCCDILLSTESSPEIPEQDHEELKKSLESVLNIVQLTHDKVGFLKFYETITTPRIIFDKSKSNELEDFMILQLQQLADTVNEEFRMTGTDAVSVKGLKGISENLKASKDVNDRFKALIQSENDPTIIPNFSVMVIDAKNWPYKKSSPYSISGQYLTVLPVFESTIERFNTFYRKTFSGREYPTKGNDCRRKLTWLNNLGKGELNAQLSGKRFILLTGAFQTAMLMAFNEKDSYTFQELKEVSGTIEVPKSFLVKTMMKLFESKILICSGDSRNIEPDTTISLNTNFESKKTRISLETALNFDDANSQGDESLSQNDYENLANLAMVRIFKRKKRLNQNDLLYNLTLQLKNLFRPERETMLRSIQYCLKNSYIRVDEKDENFYIYIE